MTLAAAADMSWEELTAQARAHTKLRARTMHQFMIAANGDAEGWRDLQSELLKIING